jgi:hypothetical protein
VIEVPPGQLAVHYSRAYFFVMPVTICDERDIVLVVDDEEMILEVIGTLTENHGCSHVALRGH